MAQGGDTWEKREGKLEDFDKMSDEIAQKHEYVKKFGFAMYFQFLGMECASYLKEIWSNDTGLKDNYIQSVRDVQEAMGGLGHDADLPASPLRRDAWKLPFMVPYESDDAPTHGVPPEEVVKRFLGGDSFEVVGGAVLTSAMALHLARWPGFFSMRDEVIMGTIGLVSCRNSPQFIVHWMALYDAITDEDAMAEILTGYVWLLCIKEFKGMGEGVSPIASSARGHLSQLRNEFIALWGTHTNDGGGVPEGTTQEAWNKRMRGLRDGFLNITFQVMARPHPHHNPTPDARMTRSSPRAGLDHRHVGAPLSLPQG